MLLAVFAFLFFTALTIGTYAAIVHLPKYMAGRELQQRLESVTPMADHVVPDAPALVKEDVSGPAPLRRLIERSGVNVTSRGIIVSSAGFGVGGAFLAMAVTVQSFAWIIAALLGALSPFVWLKFRARRRLARFEEQFPEALDLLSRAIRAG